MTKKGKKTAAGGKSGAKRTPPKRGAAGKPTRRRSGSVGDEQLLRGAEPAFRSMLDDMNVVFFASDAEGRLTSVSPSVERVAGYLPAEIIGRNFSEFIHPQDLPHIQSQFERLSRGIVEPDEYRIRTKAGRTRWVLSSSRPVFDRRKVFTGVVGMLIDVERSRSAEEAFRETDELFRNTFDLAAVGIAHLALDWTWLRVNDTLCEIVGYSSGELETMQFSAITHRDDRPADAAALAGLADGRVQTVTREKRIMRKDGFTVTVSSTVAAVRDAAGAVKYYIVIIEDITGRKRMEDTLQMLRTAVGSIPLGVTITNLDGRIIYVNPAEARMHGYAADELLGREARILANPEQGKGGELKELFARGRIDDTLYTRERMNLRKDGTEFPVELRSVPARDLRGTPLGLITVAEDITDRKSMIDALRESEQKYRTLFESASDAIFIADAVSGVIIDCNISACVLLGMTRDEIIGLHQAGLHPPEDAAEYRKRFRTISEQRGEGMFYDNVVVRKNGERLVVDISSKCIESRGQQLLMGIFRDVTERKKAETAVRLAKQDWESTFDTITDMITIHDENFTIVRSNKAASQILGLPWLEMGKAKCFEYYHGTACPPEHCPSCRSLRTGEPSLHEMFEPHLNKYLEIRAIPRKDPTGNVVGLIHVVRDISARKKAEAEKMALEARLIEAQRMETIGSLAGGVAHEVRNPLNAIMALTDALDREIGSNAEYHTFMQHMRAQVDRLSTLMTDLLELGKPVDQARLRAESLPEICALSVDAWRLSKWGQGREVTTSLCPPRGGAPPSVLADAKKLQQVFINLLDNAAQHSPEGSPIAIEIPESEGGWAEVRVVDRGSGIAPDLLPKVFDAFFTTRRGGTGLGLSIVKHIVEKHGGAVALANNTVPPGCTVSVVLPALKETP